MKGNAFKGWYTHQTQSSKECFTIVTIIMMLIYEKLTHFNAMASLKLYLNNNLFCDSYKLNIISLELLQYKTTFQIYGLLT